MYPQRTWTAVARCLAAAFLAGVWNERALLRRGSAALDQRPRWLLPVVREVLAAYHHLPADRPRELARFVFAIIERERRVAEWESPPELRRWFVPEPAMGRVRWPVPEIPSLGALAAFLSLPAGDVAWLTRADWNVRPRTNGYADDLTDSGGTLPLARSDALRTTAGTIAREEGFAVNERKSALMTRAGRQPCAGSSSTRIRTSHARSTTG